LGETPSRRAASEGLKKRAEAVTNHLDVFDGAIYRAGPSGRVKGARARGMAELAPRHL
jgi:hypothetical protein